MDWLKKLKKSEDKNLSSPEALPDDPAVICLEAFKSHWLQIYDVVCATSQRSNGTSKKGRSSTKVEQISADHVDTVRNLLEQMIFLLIEEQCSGSLRNPILDFAVNQAIFEKLYFWWESASTHKEEIMLNLLKVYEVLISQAQHSLLHHKELVSPMLLLLSCSSQTKSEELDGHIVLLLNLLCVWMNRDPTLLDVFFNASAAYGPDKFLIFSLLTEYIHREGTVGQQSRDALLLCVALSSENSSIADYIVEHSNFCPVLAAGLSALYSTLPRHMDVRADDWHCLQKSDWSQVPELMNFMNSFDFCNSVAEVSCDSVSEQLLDFFYNGFLVSVFGPSLHKTSADEVVITTAYLNLFLRSATAPALMRCFLRFLLTHRHESSLIVNTLIQRIASNNKLALVSLSLIRTLVDLNCEDLLLQLVFRYLLPCQHILASQRRAICDVDIYNASASRFLALTPAVCAPESPSDKEEEIFLPVSDEVKQYEKKEDSSSDRASLSNEVSSDAEGNNAFHHLSPPSPPMHESASIRHPFFRKSKTSGMSSSNGDKTAMPEYTVNEDLSVTVNLHPATGSESMEEEDDLRGGTITSPSTMAEFGPDLQSQLQLNTSYMDYLEDARVTINQCREACSGWSAAYDGAEPVDVKPPDQDATTRSMTDASSQEKQETTRIISDDVESANRDDLHCKASDSTMKALSATYQTLNLTASAFSRNNSDEPSSLQSLNPKQSPQLTKRNATLQLSTDAVAPDANENKIVNHDNAVHVEVVDVKTEDQDELSMVRKPVMCDSETTPLAACDKSLDGSTKEATETSSNTTQDTLDIGRTYRSLSTTTTTSSVDEFFRSLMEIVPKTTKDRAESSKNKTSKELKATDEDIESGIEVSSDGDAQATSCEQTVEDKNQESGASENNEDTMSQLSLSTDEIEGTEKPSKSFSKTPEKSSAGETLRSYSFADDSDDEFDDSSSIISSSFYEANDEYEPTEVSVGPAVPLKVQGLPYTGPLIGNLFAKLDQMINNSLYENLLLTGIVTRLAAYPQPLLRSFLLNTHMVFHPSVRSLYQILNSARNKIDAYAAEVSDFRMLVHRAQKYLLARGTYPFSGDARTRNTIKDRPMPVPKVKTRTLGDMFKRKKLNDATKKKSLIPSLDSLLERRNRSGSKGSEGGSIHPQDGGTDQSAAVFYVKQRNQMRAKELRKMKELRTKNAVYASIVLAEFLKELAAVAQEHAVAQI